MYIHICICSVLSGTINLNLQQRIMFLNTTSARLYYPKIDRLNKMLQRDVIYSTFFTHIQDWKCDLVITAITSRNMFLISQIRQQWCNKGNSYQKAPFRCSHIHINRTY